MGAQVNGAPVTISETAPADPADGDLWWADSDVDDGGGRLYTWTGDEWVDVSIPGGALLKLTAIPATCLGQATMTPQLVRLRLKVKPPTKLASV